MKKTAKKQSPAMIIAGAAILFAAALIILLAIFIPRGRENRIFHARYQMLQSAEYTTFLLSDPFYKTGDVIATRGVEVALSPDEVVDIRTRLAAVRVGGIKNGENLTGTDGAWDVRLQVRLENGTRAELYFTETLMYFYADGTAFTFLAKDESAYEGLYHALQNILKANA